MIDALNKTLYEYELIQITESNFEQAVVVYNTNQEFFILTSGKEAEAEDCINDMSAIPPDFNMNNKLYIGIWENGKIVAVLDLLMGYPDRRIVWIGLLLIHGKLHGEKYGSKIFTAVLEASKSLGYKTIQLGVIENNIIGLKFWIKHGFEKRKSIIGQEKLDSPNIIVMERHIA